MTIDKAINEDDLIKAKMRADFLRRYEKAKEKGFKGDLDDFIRRIENQGLKKGGPVKPNGVTTISLDEYLETIDPGGWATEDDKPMKVSFKYGATSQAEEDLIGGHVDDWTNAINKGDLDPSTTFMQYIDMLLGRYNRGGIISVVPKFS
jgi:hypothetical protein